MECERSNQDDPLRQGDILAAHPGTEAWKDPWSRFGVVISADCDIANKKTGPSLVYVPIITHYAYLADIWIPQEAQHFARKGRELVDRKLKDFDPRLSSRHVSHWSEQGGSEGLREKLMEEALPPLAQKGLAKKADVIVQLWSAIEKLERIAPLRASLDPEKLRVLLTDFIAQRSLIEPRSGDELEASRALVQSALTSLQDRLDTWLIRELVGLDPEMQEATQFGFIVPLRNFAQLEIGKIDADRTSWYKNPDHYLRVCRLRGIYKADLLQKFTNLFIRVGLEDHRDEEHRRLFRRFAETIFPAQ